MPSLACLMADSLVRSVQAEGIRRHGSAWIMLLWKNSKHEYAYPQPRRVASTLSLHANLFKQIT